MREGKKALKRPICKLWRGIPLQELFMSLSDLSISTPTGSEFRRFRTCLKIADDLLPLISQYTKKAEQNFFSVPYSFLYLGESVFCFENICSLYYLLFQFTSSHILMYHSSKWTKIKNQGTYTICLLYTSPEEWKNQFGIPVEEHQKSMQVNIFEGYAVFDIQEKKKARCV